MRRDPMRWNVHRSQESSGRNRGRRIMGAEKNFEEKVKRYLKSIGVYPLGTPPDKMIAPPIGYYEKRWGGGTFTKSGLPDLHIVIHGYSVDVELKSQNGRPSDLQIFVIKQIRAAGGFAFVLYPSGYSDFVEFITDLKHEIYNRETTPEIMKGR